MARGVVETDSRGTRRAAPQATGGVGDHIRRGDPADLGWSGMSVRSIPATPDGDGRVGLLDAGIRRDSKSRVARDEQQAHRLEEK